MSQQQQPNKIPRVRVMQDENADPVRVVITDDKGDPSLFLFSAMIFVATFLGTIIGLIADSGAIFETIEQFNEVLNPPPTLCIAGSNTMLGDAAMGDEWKAEFEALEDVNVDIAAIGSVSGAQRAVDGGCVHVLAMSEPMPEATYSELTNAGYRLDCAAEVGFDVIAFVTNLNNPLVRDVRNPDDPEDNRPRVRPILASEMRGMLSGSIRNWSELANWPRNAPDRPITIHLRPGSGTSDVVLRRLASFIPTEDVPFPQAANYDLCASNLDCLNRTLSQPGSVYWVSVAWMRTQPQDYLRVLSILQGDEVSVNPLRETVDLEEYPSQLVRPLYLYVLDHPDRISDEENQLARAFMTYARGVQGQQMVDASGFYNHFSRPVDIEVAFPTEEQIFAIPLRGTRTICK